MKIYLVRHGDALSESTENGRPLSPHGREQVEKVGACLARMNIEVESIECSTKLRAYETAQILARHLGSTDKVAERKGLKPNDSLGAVLSDLQEARGDRMLVGHLPYMEYMASALLVGAEARVNLAVRPATCLCFSGRFGSPFILEWMIGPDLF